MRGRLFNSFFIPLVKLYYRRILRRPVQCLSATNEDHLSADPFSFFFVHSPFQPFKNEKIRDNDHLPCSDLPFDLVSSRCGFYSNDRK